MERQPVQLSADVKSDAVLLVSVCSESYSERVVLRALHSLAPRVIGCVVSRGGGSIRVSLAASSGELLLHTEMQQRFMIALGDFVLREQLESETRASRELIVRQAFERSNLQWPQLDDALPGQDPLGLSAPDPETGRKHGEG